MMSKSLKILGFLSVLTALLLFSNPTKALASEAHNIRGWAYNTTYGYISFNCLDDGYAGYFPFSFPFLFNIPPCYSSSYGVNLDAKNNNNNALVHLAAKKGHKDIVELFHIWTGNKNIVKDKDNEIKRKDKQIYEHKQEIIEQSQSLLSSIQKMKNILE